MLIKYEGVVKVFNENIRKSYFCAFFGCDAIFEHDHPLKTSEKRRFSGVFRGYRNACSWKLQVFFKYVWPFSAHQEWKGFNCFSQKYLSVLSPGLWVKSLPDRVYFCLYFLKLKSTRVLKKSLQMFS